MNAPTVEQRLKTIQHAAVLIASALSAESADANVCTVEDLVAAAAAHAQAIVDELYWLRKNAGAAVLNAPAPTDDEQAAAERKRGQ